LTSCSMPRMAAPGTRLPYTLRSLQSAGQEERDDRSREVF
jgi:hypothetical protein